MHIVNSDQHPTPCKSCRLRSSLRRPRGCRSSTACNKTSANGAQLQGNGSGRRSRWRTGLSKVLTVVKDVRSTSRVRSPRGDARVETARNTCTPSDSTERPPSVAFWRCRNDAAVSAFDQASSALNLAWAELTSTIFFQGRPPGPGLRTTFSAGTFAGTAFSDFDFCTFHLAPSRPRLLVPLFSSSSTAPISVFPG